MAFAIHLNMKGACDKNLFKPNARVQLVAYVLILHDFLIYEFICPLNRYYFSLYFSLKVRTVQKNDTMDLAIKNQHRKKAVFKHHFCV